jgi:hypothetical protein
MLFGGKTNKGSGGTISNVNTYTLHTFTTSGTYTPTSTGFVDILVIGGGGNAAPGAGQFTLGGSGGAGATALSKFVKLTAGSNYPVTVASAGGTTSFGSIVSAAGGGAGAFGSGFPSPLASGGGSATWGSDVPGGTGAGVYGIGFPAFVGSCNSYGVGSGGGGAGSGGPSTTKNQFGRQSAPGGNGVPISYFTGNLADVVCWGGGTGVPSSWGSGGASPQGLGQPGIAFIRYI